MTTAMDLIFTTDQICDAARDNVTSLCLAMTSYLKNQNQNPQDFWAFTGRLFSRSWTEVSSARDFVETAALNMVSADSRLQALSGGRNHAEVILTNWPGDEALARFDLTQDEADYTADVFVAIGQEIGFECNMERVGPELKMIVDFGQN